MFHEDFPVTWHLNIITFDNGIKLSVKMTPSSKNFLLASLLPASSGPHDQAGAPRPQSVGHTHRPRGCARGPGLHHPNGAGDVWQDDAAADILLLLLLMCSCWWQVAGLCSPAVLRHSGSDTAVVASDQRKLQHNPPSPSVRGPGLRSSVVHQYKSENYWGIICYAIILLFCLLSLILIKINILIKAEQLKRISF